MIVAPTSSTEAQATKPADSGSALSTGGIIGVSVSVVCSVLGLVFGIGFKIWQHRREEKKKAEAAAAVSDPFSSMPKPTEGHYGQGVREF